MKNVRLADSTRAMKQAIIDRDILPVFGNRLMHEVNPAWLRAICYKLVEDRGAKAAALQVWEIVGSVFTYAIDHGLDVVNPAEYVKASSIATFEARERALKPHEIKIFFLACKETGASATLKLAIHFVLITLVRKSELTQAEWRETDSDKSVWMISVQSMKVSREHNIYLSKQAMDIMIGLQVCTGGSD